MAARPTRTLSSFVFLIFAGLCLLPLSFCVPFVVLYGIGDSCSKTGVSRFTEILGNWTSAQGYCIEIGDGSWDSWVWSLQKQTEIACEKVKSIDALSDGYNIVGLSQGNMVARGLIEFCDGAPQVKNYVSLAGPHAGIASCPFCGSAGLLQSWITHVSVLMHSELVCVLVDYLIELGVYSEYVQEHLAPSGYIKVPTDIKSYLRGCQFLPYINNEIINERNATYKERFTSIRKLVLIMFEKDSILVPKETSWFGYYPDGSMDTVLPANETKLYTEDWIGLKTLDEAGKVDFITAPGGHLTITHSLMQNYIVPYLEADDSEHKTGIAESSAYRWFSSLRSPLTNLLFF